MSIEIRDEFCGSQKALHSCNVFPKQQHGVWWTCTCYYQYIGHWQNYFIIPSISRLPPCMKWLCIDLMHWRHVSITTTPCWGSRLVALRAHVLLAERIGAHPLSQCAHPGQLGGEACRGLPSECMLGDGARGVPRLTPNTTGAPFCDVICIWSII